MVSEHPESGSDPPIGSDQKRGATVCVFWKQLQSSNVCSFSKHHIDLEVLDMKKGKWRLTGLYGHPERSKRHVTWDLIRKLHATSPLLPWCLVGDFNDMLYSLKKLGHVPHPEWLFSGFREASSDCNLHDLDLQGYCMDIALG